MAGKTVSKHKNSPDLLYLASKNLNKRPVIEYALDL